MLRSFRLRLAFTSALISGLVVLSFGTMAWWSLSRSRIKSLDDDLRNFGYRVALRTGRNAKTENLEASLVDAFGAERVSDRFFALLTSQPTLIYSTSNWPGALSAMDYPPGRKPLDPQPEDQYRRPSERRTEPRTVLEPRFYTTTFDGTPYRIGVFANPDVILVLGANLDQHVADMHQLRRAFLLALPGALLVVALGAAFVGWRALRPVETLSRDMENLSARDLDRRLDVNGADREFERIIENYNAMLERLERSFHQATRFSADASHELKTPLAIMQGTIEGALAKCEDGSETQATLNELLEQTGHQLSILEGLLLLSRAEGGRLELSWEKINLCELLETWLEDAGFLAEHRNITISSEIEPELRIEGDPVALQQVAHNLFSNAVRYNHDEGEIHCRLSKDGDEIEWSVANTGSPIPPDEADQIFDRFYRSKSSGTSGGIGLGLSLVKEIVHAHGGSVELDRDTVGMNCFRVRLPVSPIITSL